MDANTLAKSIVDQAIGEKPIKKPVAKSAQAVARGKARWKGVEAGAASQHAKDIANKRWHPDTDSVKIEAGQ